MRGPWRDCASRATRPASKLERRANERVFGAAARERQSVRRTSEPASPREARRARRGERRGIGMDLTEPQSVL